MTDTPFSPASRGIWSRLAWLGIFAIAMGLLEAICVIYLRRLLPIDKLTPAPLHGHHRIEVLREACTIVMLIGVAWLAGINARSRLACFLFVFGIWDIVYYAGLWWFASWPSSMLTWDCLFLIPKPWHGPVLAPVLISLYFALGCCWVHAREIRGEPVYLSGSFVASQLLAFAAWYWSFVKDTDWITVHRYEGVTYSWPLFAGGMVLGVFGGWLSARSSGSRSALRSVRIGRP